MNSVLIHVEKSACDIYNNEKYNAKKARKETEERKNNEKRKDPDWLHGA
jgi:hypothetical protein